MDFILPYQIWILHLCFGIIFQGQLYKYLAIAVEILLFAMAHSLLFSQDDMSSFSNNTSPAMHNQPILLNHWLAQQQLPHRSLNTQHIPRNMPTNNQSYSHQSQRVDDPSHNEYTFETQPPQPHDEYHVWSPQTNIFPMNLNVQTTMHQSRSPAPIPYSDSNWVNEYTHDFNNGISQGSPTSPYLTGPEYSPDSALGSLGPYLGHPRSPSSLAYVSPTNSDPSLSPLYPSSTGLPSPSTPGSTAQSFAPSPTMSDMNNMLVLDSQHHIGNPERPRYTHREQLAKFKEVMAFPMDGAGPFIPQLMYKPHTTSDRKRYVEEVMLEGPLYFISEHPQQYGISLRDALHSRTKRLRDRDQIVFEGRGPSVSIRLEWPGYRQWSRQIPTKDFRSPPQPITLAKLAKNVAKCVQRFMLDRKAMPMEEDCDSRWKIGDGADDIKLDDLVLVSIHHVSLGSWQPQLRLIRPLRQRSSRVSVPAHSLVTPPNGSPSSLTPYPQFS